MFDRQLSTMAELVGTYRGERMRSAAHDVRTAFQSFVESVEVTRLPAWSQVHAWTIRREELLARAGLEDPYREIKDRENHAALAALPSVLSTIRSGRDDDERLRRALAATLLGNRFDFGSPLIGAIDAGDPAEMATRTLVLTAETWLTELGVARSPPPNP